MNRPKTANGSVTPTPRRAAESRTQRRSSRPTPKSSPASTISPGGHPRPRTRARGSSPLRGSSPHARASKPPAPGQLGEAATEQHVGNYLATSGDSCWPLTAFEFEAIRMLEGYWGAGRLRTAVAEWRSGRHLRRRNRLRAVRDTASRDAFRYAREEMVGRGVERPVINVIEDRRANRDLSYASGEDLRKAKMLNWLDYAPTKQRRRLDAAVAALRYYPRADQRILPTRLGNTLRAYEERVHDMGIGPLEAYVQRVFHELPASLQLEHDQFRSRLDLYCALVLVFLAIGAFGVLVLSDQKANIVVITALSAGALAWLSYRAAVASARGYGGVLVTIARIAGRR